MKPHTIFVDSDVIISSFLSSLGAASFLLQKEETEKYISNYSEKEILQVMERMGILKSKFDQINKRLKKVVIDQSLEEVKQAYLRYVLDSNDAHIVAGVAMAKSDFLITYNTKDYKIDKIKDAFHCIVTTPANYLQYLRSV